MMSGGNGIPQAKTERLLFPAAAVLLHAAAVLALYLKYVPRTGGLQAVLAPLVFICLLTAAFSPGTSTLLVVFCIPLVNALPHFFHVPGFQPLLFIFLAYFTGILIYAVRRPGAFKLRNPLFVPIAGASAVVMISMLLTFWRYTNFFPLYLSAVPDLAVNVLNVTAGEALRRSLFDGLNHLAGFIWFFAVLNTLKTRKIFFRAVTLLAFSSFLSFGFGLFQDASNSGIGNRSPFIESWRVNGLFSDPNALGVFLAMSLPLFAASFLRVKGTAKYMLLAAFVTGAALVPDSGSRVGMMGVAGGLALLVLCFARLAVRARKADPGLTKRLAAYAGAAVLAGSLVAVYVTVSKRSALHHRIGENIRAMKVLYNPRAREIILHGRHLTWPAAARMIGNFPLSGTGIGAFTSELPNYFAEYGIAPFKSSFYYREIPPPDFHVDTAGNYYLHIAAETGIIGLFFFGWIFFLVLRHIVHSQWKRNYDPEWSFPGIGISSAVSVMCVIFLFGVHTLNFEIQMTFWLFIGLLFAIPGPATGADKKTKKKAGQISVRKNERESKQEKGLNPGQGVKKGKSVFPSSSKALIGIPVVVFFLFHSWNSFGRLSLAGRTERFHLDQSFGLYQKETMDGRLFQWTAGAAGMTLRMKKPALAIPVLASHPGIEKNPVRVKLFLTKTLFKEKTMLGEIVLRDKRWHELVLSFPGRVGSEFLLYFDVGRTWEPGKAPGSKDPRELGIALGRPEFRDESGCEAPLREDSVFLREAAETAGCEKLHPPAGSTVPANYGEALYAFDLSGWKLEETAQPPERHMWCAPVTLPEGSYFVRLVARGRRAGGEPPLLAVRIGGRLKAEAWIISDDWQGYLFRIDLEKKTRGICVQFMNTGYIHQTREFRRLSISSLQIFPKS